MPEIQVILPEAPPQQYLRWMAFWREVEQRMGESPALEELAASESAPFIRDEIAVFLSERVASAIADQANRALREGSVTIAPVLQVERDLIVEGARFVALRTRWMTQERLEAMGVEPLEPILVALRSEVLVAVANQLSSTPG